LLDVKNSVYIVCIESSQAMVVSVTAVIVTKLSCTTSRIVV